MSKTRATIILSFTSKHNSLKQKGNKLVRNYAQIAIWASFQCTFVLISDNPIWRHTPTKKVKVILAPTSAFYQKTNTILLPQHFTVCKEKNERVSFSGLIVSQNQSVRIWKMKEARNPRSPWLRNFFGRQTQKVMNKFALGASIIQFSWAQIFRWKVSFAKAN